MKWALAVLAIGVFIIIASSLAGRRRQRSDHRAVEIEIDATPDLPTGFGYKMTWLAVRADSSDAVMKSLSLSAAVPANWRSGDLLIYNSRSGDPRVFVTPAVQGWVIIAGTPVDEPTDEAKHLKWDATIRSLSKQFGDCQYFGNHRVSSYFAWSRWKDGNLVRRFIYGDGDETSFGEETPEEARLPFKLPLDPSIPQPKRPPGVPEEEFRFPDEEDVMTLAERWSINPQLLEKFVTTPSVGTIAEWTIK